MFALLIVESSELVHRNEIFATVFATIVLSIFAHGLAAWPFAVIYGRRTRARGECVEMQPVPPAPFLKPSSAKGETS